MMGNLTEHFTEEELTYSDTAIKYGSTNAPSAIHRKTLKHTCEYFLEPFRKLLNEYFMGKPYFGKTVKQVIIKITSGYRSETVNSLLEKEGYHPSKTSQHCTGEAVDLETVLIYTDDTRNILPYQETYTLIKTWVKEGKLSVDQCLQEKQGKALWVHCSYKAGGVPVNRKQFKKTTDGINFVADGL